MVGKDAISFSYKAEDLDDLCVAKCGNPKQVALFRNILSLFSPFVLPDMNIFRLGGNGSGLKYGE